MIYGCLLSHVFLFCGFIFSATDALLDRLGLRKRTMKVVGGGGVGHPQDHNLASALMYAIGEEGKSSGCIADDSLAPYEVSDEGFKKYGETLKKAGVPPPHNDTRKRACTAVVDSPRARTVEKSGLLISLSLSLSLSHSLLV